MSNLSGASDTELPDAAALSDSVSNPTTPMVGAAGMLWTGSAWFRHRMVSSVGDSGTSGIAAVGTTLFNGSTWDRQRTPAVFKVVDLAAGTTETTIWDPAAGKKFRLMGFLLTCEVASTLTFKDNTAGTTIFVTRGGVDVPISPSGLGNGILSGTADNVLTVTRGTSTALRGVVWGTEE